MMAVPVSPEFPRVPEADGAHATPVAFPDFEILLSQYRPLLWGESRHAVRKPIGMPWEDWDQEARIGLWFAWRTYDPTRGVPFARWAARWVRSHLITVARTATRKKHRLLTDAWSSDAQRGIDDADPWADVDWRDDQADPAWIVESAAMQQWLMRQVLIRLTPRERAAWCQRRLLRRFDGSRATKADDNARQRARRKLQAAWREEWG